MSRNVPKPTIPTLLATPNAVEKQLKETVKKAAESQRVKDPEMPASIRNALKIWMIANPRGRREAIPEYLCSAINDWDGKGRPVRRKVIRSPETGRSEGIRIPDLGFKPKSCYKDIEN